MLDYNGHNVEKNELEIKVDRQIQAIMPNWVTVAKYLQKMR